MPHDRRGQALKVGDRVVIPGKVTDIGPNPDYCNCTVESEEGMFPEGHKSSFSLNTGQVERVTEIPVSPSPSGNSEPEKLEPEIIEGSGI